MCNRPEGPPGLQDSNTTDPPAAALAEQFPQHQKAKATRDLAASGCSKKRTPHGCRYLKSYGTKAKEWSGL